jgi:hypothetical protein
MYCTLPLWEWPEDEVFTGAGYADPADIVDFEALAEYNSDET